MKPLLLLLVMLALIGCSGLDRDLDNIFCGWTKQQSFTTGPLAPGLCWHEDDPCIALEAPGAHSCEVNASAVDLAPGETVEVWTHACGGSPTLNFTVEICPR